ncbi:MAG: extracellular solute-binding protein [Oscillospiraceae bacterium]|nr:extracellular solute-binding protein [Oscillospiraceae bacterium]MBQ6902132.1 extracellular solute-binding protein [Oscillospiraceae bacterium]
MKKRIIALILAGIMMLALCACGKGSTGQTVLDGQDPNEPLTSEDVISIIIPSSASYPIKEDFVLWDYMEEGSGATLKIIPIPDVDASTKYPLMFASKEELPDVMAFGVVNAHTPYAGEGLVAFDDLKEYMPNYNAWLESLSPEEYDIAVKNRKRADGKIYYTPGTGREGKTRMRAWLYREDIFKKHNLKAPETFDEIYEVSKALKELYPESYPYSTRSFSYVFDLPGSSFDKWWQHGAYYDFDDEEWRWGATEDTALEVLTFYNRMINEKLMPSDCVTMNGVAFDELVVTDRTFIMPHLQLKIDYYNQIAQQKNAEFKIQAFVPPVANPEKGVSMMERGDIEMIGLSICDTGKAEGIANSAKFIDWMYTDEAMELVSWGKEGETYEVVDGKKRYITDEVGTSADIMYGFSLYGTFTRFAPDAAAAFQSETTRESADIVAGHQLPYYPVTLWLDFNDEEQAVIDMYKTGLQTHTQEMLVKFMLGQEPLSNFDKFVETINSMGVDEVLAAYESAYSRVK